LSTIMRREKLVFHGWLDLSLIIIFYVLKPAGAINPLENIRRI
jgi:hypothetical protein